MDLVSQFTSNDISDILFSLTSSTDTRTNKERFKILEKLENISTLTKQGMDLLRKVNGFTVFSHACFHGMTEVVAHLMEMAEGQGLLRELLNCGMPPPLWLATAEGNDLIISTFSGKKAMLDLPIKAPDGTTPLQIAVIKEQLKCVSALESVLYSRDEIEREIIRFGSNTLSDKYGIHVTSRPDDGLEISAKSGNRELQQTLPNMPNKQETLLQDPVRHSHTTFLTRLSQKYPVFNEYAQESCWSVNWEGTVNEHGDIMISLEDDIEKAFMKKFHK